MTTSTPEPTATDILATVKAVTGQSNQRPRAGGFRMTEASVAERIIAPVLGLYLGYAVVRISEVFTEFAVPKGPMIMMLIFIGLLGLTIPAAAWTEIWRRSRSLRLVAVITGLAFCTLPVGFWPGGSYEFITDKFLVSITIFVSCLVLLRDRRCLRAAVTVYVLCVGAVSLNVITTYDPNAIILDSDGVPIAPEELAAHPDLRRLVAVGVSLDPNDFGAILAAAFPLALWLSVGNAGRRIFWTTLAGLMVAAVVPTQSRGSMIGFLAAAIVMFGAGARGWRRWLTLALVLGGAALFVEMATGIGASSRFSNFSSNDYNLSEQGGRWFFWKQGFIWMLRRPWGYGISNFPNYFGMIWGRDRASHSIWVQYGMELGVLGLLTFVTLCRTLIKGLRKIRALAGSRSSDALATSEDLLAGHMLAMMAAVLVAGSFLSIGYYPLMYMSLGLAGATLLGTPIDLSTSIESSPLAPPTTEMNGRLPRRRLRAATGR